MGAALNKLTAFLVGCLVVVLASGATVYNLFSPGGALSGTWNSQSVDLTQTSFLTGPLGVTKGGTGVATLTGLALGTGTTAFGAYAGTSCTNQFPRSLDLNGAATCSTVANTDLANSVITINGTAVALGGTRALTLASADFVNQGTTTTVLHGNAAGNPSFATVTLTTDVGGILPIVNGGNGTANPTANPTGTVGLTAVNGTATTYPRSDSAPALSQAIAPTWTGTHLFTAAPTVAIGTTGTSLGVNSGFPDMTWINAGGAVNSKLWDSYADGATLHNRVINDANSVAQDWLQVLRSGITVTSVTLPQGGLIVGAPTGGSQGTGTVNATGVYSNGTQLLPILSGTSGSIGGAALLAGQCSSGTVAITGATTSMVALTDPQTYPGDGTVWDATVTSANTVTVKVCAIVALSPTASLYNVRVLQ